MFPTQEPLVPHTTLAPQAGHRLHTPASCAQTGTASAGCDSESLAPALSTGVHSESQGSKQNSEPRARPSRTCHYAPQAVHGDRVRHHNA